MVNPKSTESSSSMRSSSRMSNVSSSSRRSSPISIVSSSHSSSLNLSSYSITSSTSSSTSFGCPSTMNKIPNSPRITLITYQQYKPVKRIEPILNQPRQQGVKKFTSKQRRLSIPFGTDLDCNLQSNRKMYHHPNFNSNNIKNILNHCSYDNENKNEDAKQDVGSYWKLN